jgi:DHA1 family bicyclomycin/chloramphenicol resistance-like MFS transporter
MLRRGDLDDLWLASGIVDPSVIGPVSRSTERRVPSGWRLVALIGSLAIFGPLCLDIYVPALPNITRNLHASPSAVQFTMTSCIVGLGAGQLVLGPVSDRTGRRLPLLGGLAAFVLASVACAFAPNVYVLGLFRLIQGLGGAAGMGMARSIARDLHSGVALVRFFSTLTIATGLGPLIAPQIGSGILSFTTWRGIFIALAILGAVLLWSAWLRVPETLPEQFRSQGTLRSTGAAFRRIGSDRAFVSLALTGAMGMGGVFVYAAGSTFVLQNIYGLSPQVYSIVFASGGLGWIAGAQVNGQLAAHFRAPVLLTAGCLIMIGGGALVLLMIRARSTGLAGFIPAAICFLFGSGFVGTNAIALALQRYPDAAGAASALVGAVQFGLGGLAAPLAGVGGQSDAYPMVFLMIILPTAALACRLLAAGTSGRSRREWSPRHPAG